MLLYRLHHHAVRLQALRPWCFGLALAGVAIVAHAVLGAADRGDLQLRLGMLLTMWALMLLCFLQCFRRIPPPVLPHDGWFTRLCAHLRLWGYRGVALAVALLGIILLSTSLKLLATA